MSNYPNQPPGPMPPPQGGMPPPPGGMPPSNPYGPPQFNNTSSNRIAAGVCGILLGGLGVHKFIYGATTPGVIMLVICLVGGFFTCGIASAVVGVIGLIEGIIYLTKSDQEFYEVYQVGKKGWF